MWPLLWPQKSRFWYTLGWFLSLLWAAAHDVDWDLELILCFLEWETDQLRGGDFENKWDWDFDVDLEQEGRDQTRICLFVSSWKRLNLKDSIVAWNPQQKICFRGWGEDSFVKSACCNQSLYHVPLFLPPGLVGQSDDSSLTVAQPTSTLHHARLSPLHLFKNEKN